MWRKFYPVYSVPTVLVLLKLFGASWRSVELTSKIGDGNKIVIWKYRVFYVTSNLIYPLRVLKIEKNVSDKKVVMQNGVLIKIKIR